MKYYLGIDGGGTKTRAVLIDENLNILFDKTYLGSNLLTVGVESFTEVFTTLKADLNAITPTIDYAFFAMAGFGESLSINNQIEKIIKDIFKNTNCVIKNDSFGAWAGSLLGKDGINVIAGTGSICSGVKENQYERVGGWSYLIGDEGSGYWVALKSLNLYSKMYDGRIVRDEIFMEEIDMAYNLTDSKNFFELVYQDMNAVRSEVAKVSVQCAKAAEKGSSFAAEILREGAIEMVLAIKTIATKMNFSSNILVSYAGGMFNSNIYKDAFVNELNQSEEDFVIVDPATAPAFGSAIYAFKLDNHQITNELEKKYLNNIAKHSGV